MKALVFKDPDPRNTLTKVIDLKENEYPVHKSMVWMDDAPEGCELGWIVVDGAITAPPAEPALPYNVERRRSYPFIGDQLDDLFHKGAFSDEMVATLQAVKTKWPKDNSGPVE